MQCIGILLRHANKKTTRDYLNVELDFGDGDQ